MAKKTDDRVTKRRVTMRSITLDPTNGKTIEITSTDYVRPDFLDAYVADAKTRWAFVEVSDEPDAGPAGYDGATAVPAHLNHRLAGTYYPASDCKKCTHAPDGYAVITPEPEV